MYHGIVIPEGFNDPSLVDSFKLFAKKRSNNNGWALCGISVHESEVNEVIHSIQNQLRADEPWYAHLYNDEELIVIFKQKIFRVTPHQSSWKPVIEYGRTIGIPDEQLDFWPNRFQDEIHYFSREDFIAS